MALQPCLSHDSVGAPASRRRWTALAWPYCTATMSGVPPERSVASRGAPAWITASKAATSPLLAAYMSGVHSVTLALESPRLGSTAAAARMRGTSCGSSALSASMISGGSCVFGSLTPWSSSAVAALSGAWSLDNARRSKWAAVSWVMGGVSLLSSRFWSASTSSCALGWLTLSMSSASMRPEG